MNLWLFLTICGVTAIIVNAYSDKKKYETKYQSNASLNTRQLEELMARLEKLERRMSNIETIVIQDEKARPFERL